MKVILNRGRNNPPQLRNAVQKLSRAHGAFYTAGGLWPVLGMRSWEIFTGAKTDKWLVRTSGLLVAAVGATLLSAASTGNQSREIKIVAMATAASLAAIDFFYAAKGRISRVYLLDGCAELALLLAWCAVVGRARDDR